MAYRRLSLLTRRRSLSAASVDFVSHFGDTVDRLKYNTGALALAHAVPGTCLVIGIYGQSQGAAAGTVNGIASIVITGLSGRVYSAFPLGPPITTTFGHYIQFWGSNVRSETSCTVLVEFTNSQTQCSILTWEAMNLGTLTPYDPGGQASFGGADATDAIRLPDASIAIAFAVQPITASPVTWTGVTDDTNVDVGTAYHVSGGSQAHAAAQLLTVTASVPGAPPFTLMACASFR